MGRASVLLSAKDRGSGVTTVAAAAATAAAAAAAVAAPAAAAALRVAEGCQQVPRACRTRRRAVEYPDGDGDPAPARRSKLRGRAAGIIPPLTLCTLPARVRPPCAVNIAAYAPITKKFGFISRFFENFSTRTAGVLYRYLEYRETQTIVQRFRTIVF